jgi:hypothetical protein
MSEPEDVTYQRSVQLRRCGFVRKGDSWARRGQSPGPHRGTAPDGSR